MLQKSKVSSAMFVDGDIIWVTDSLVPVQRDLQERSVIVTPHILSAIPEDGKKQQDLETFTSGVLNFGLVAFRNSPTADAFLDFWSQRLRLFYGFVDREKGMFYDRTWAMFIPAFFDYETNMMIRDPVITSPTGIYIQPVRR
jgi:hypothetical protein